MDIDSVIKQLADIISKTPEFAQLKKLHTQVSRDNHLSALLSQFGEKQSQLFMSNQPQEKARQLMAELDRDYAGLNAMPLLKQYFAAENKVDQIIRSITEALHESLSKQL